MKIMETPCTAKVDFDKLHRVHKIPTDLSLIKEDDIIDMSKLGFGVDDSKKKYFSFIYIRNSGIKVELNFDQCSYEDKEEFLMLFMTSGIEVKSSVLASTWLEIIFNSDQPQLKSILNIEEVKKFNMDHSDYIAKLRQFINSLPLYTISIFKDNDVSIDFNDFKMNDFTNISLCNFCQLTEFEDFLLLLEDTNTENKAEYFEKIFNNPENMYHLSLMINNLPYLQFLSVMLGTQEVQNDFLKTLSNVLKEE